MKSISEETPLLPELLASTVTSDPLFIKALANRAERHFKQGGQFTRKLKGAKCREYLLMFYDHWLTAMRGDFERYRERNPGDFETEPAPELRPSDCECDNTHESAGTCCMPCWRKGFRTVFESEPTQNIHPAEPKV